jgi:hypothetical protein
MKKAAIAVLLFLSAALCFAEYEGNWLYAGARLGFAPNFYVRASELKDTVDSFDASAGFNGAAQIAVHINDFLGFQAELMYTHDEAASKKDGFEITYESHSLLFPVLAKTTFRPGDFVVSGLAGIYFTVPAGNMKASWSGGGSGSHEGSWEAPPGFMIGAQGGILLGPGLLFLDIRYASDFGVTKAAYGGGSAGLYNRGKLPIAIGYEIGFLPK